MSKLPFTVTDFVDKNPNQLCSHPVIKGNRAIAIRCCKQFASPFVNIALPNS